MAKQALHGTVSFTPVQLAEPPVSHVVTLTGLSDEADGEFVRVPPGLTAAEAQRRLDSWLALRDSLTALESAAREHGNQFGVSGNLGARLTDARAALAAAEGE